MTLERRAFVRIAAAAAAGAAVGLPRRASGLAPHEPRPALRLGVASYSLRNFPLERAIAMTQALGARWINLKSVHLPYDVSEADAAAARRALQAAGIALVGGGTITFETDTDDGVQRYFEYTRRAGLPLIVGTGDPAVMPRVERFAKRYDIRVAIHNHGPEDPHFASPYDVLRVVQRMDPRMGLCIDVGHTARTGTNVVRAIADAGPRLLDMHVKDLRDPTDAASQCAVGEGRLPFVDMFRQLEAQRFAGCVNLEYEIEPDDPLPGMQRSFAYLRGVLAGLG